VFSPSVEKPESDEAQTFSELVDTLRGITETTSKDYGHSVRAVHAKSTGLLKAEITVIDHLPPGLAQGLFAKAGRYPVVMRFSTSPGDIVADSISTPRGVGIKITGISGSAPPGESADTQDFVMINGPAFIARRPRNSWVA